MIAVSRPFAMESRDERTLADMTAARARGSSGHRGGVRRCRAIASRAVAGASKRRRGTNAAVRSARGGAERTRLRNEQSNELPGPRQMRRERTARRDDEGTMPCSNRYTGRRTCGRSCWPEGRTSDGVGTRK
jgi:hypothetical protein